MSVKEMAIYWAAQFAGAIAGAGVLLFIAGSTAHGLGQNGWGPGYGGGFGVGPAFVFEVVMTALFIIVILGSTGTDAAPGFAGLGIGIALAVIHIVGIQVTGVSVNPARSLGPAVFVGGQALAQLWLFFVAPAIGAVLGALLYRFNLLKVG
jgi:aquaporin Z